MAKFHYVFPTGLNFTKKSGPEFEFLRSCGNNHGMLSGMLLAFNKTLLIRKEYYSNPSIADEYSHDLICRFGTTPSIATFSSLLYKDNKLFGSNYLYEYQEGSDFSQFFYTATDVATVVRCPFVAGQKSVLGSASVTTPFLKNPKLLLSLSHGDYSSGNLSLRNTMFLAAMARLFLRGWELKTNVWGHMPCDVGYDPPPPWTKEFAWNATIKEDTKLVCLLPPCVLNANSFGGLMTFVHNLLINCSTKNVQAQFTEAFIEARENGIAWDEALWIAAEPLCPNALINHFANGQPYQMYGINTLAAGIGVPSFYEGQLSSTLSNVPNGVGEINAE